MNRVYLVIQDQEIVMAFTTEARARENAANRRRAGYFVVVRAVQVVR